MKLCAVVAEYVRHKRSLGMRFNTEARTLTSFCRALGDVTMARVKSDGVHAFLAGSGPVTAFWGLKHSVLCGLYRFAIARGYASTSPLPNIVPKPARAFVPYIYSREELRRLLEAALAMPRAHARIDPDVLRTLLLLLYGAALRISEALSLTMADVDLEQAVLRIRESKFYKTRLVPLGANLAEALRQFNAKRSRAYSCRLDAPLFPFRDGRPLTRKAAEDAFRRVRDRAGVLRHDGARYQPRLHDLRHSAAVHRLIAWYRGGADVQRLLPRLATYLGHVHIAATQRYLTLTPELLREASVRFERYALEVPHEQLNSARTVAPALSTRTSGRRA
jgi:integrase/recombinase XerD